VVPVSAQTRPGVRRQNRRAAVNLNFIGAGSFNRTSERRAATGAAYNKSTGCIGKLLTNPIDNQGGIPRVCRPGAWPGGNKKAEPQGFGFLGPG